MEKINDRGLLIAVFGPDGCGKTTIFNRLQDDSTKLSKKVIKFHWRPGLLPYKNKISKNTEEFSTLNYSNIKPRNHLYSHILLFFIYLDYLLGYILKIRPKLKQGITIYYERYYYDILIDSKRYGLNVFYNISRVLSKLLPEPDYVILFDAPAYIVNKRKKELSITEIEELRIRYYKELSRYKNFRVYDVFKNSPRTISSLLLRLKHSE